MIGTQARLLSVVAALTGVLSGQAAASDFYAGKTIEMIVGGAPAGGIDLYARLAARHLPNHVPGAPAIVVKNMPGASGGRVIQFVGMVAPGNGLTIGATAPGAIVAPLLDDKVDPAFNPAQVTYIGTTNVGVSVCATLNTARVRTFQDAMKTKMTLGSQGPGSPSYDIAYLMKNLTGAPFNIITGYNGSTHITLAMERGEVDGICGWNWSGARSQKADWIRDGKLVLLAQIGADDHPELTKMGVPPIWKFISGDENKKVAEFILAQKGFERPLFVRGDTPGDLVKILRAAFDATVGDQRFLADADKATLEISPASGAKVQELVKSFYATPKSIVDKARDAIRP
jgi:tripartite-type tricarboxylate transporter receptor subunit TctC